MDVQERVEFRIGERRLTHWFKEVGPNLKTLGGELKDTVAEGVQGKDPIKLAMTPVVAAARVLLQGPDYVYSGIVDRKVEKVDGSETIHDLKSVGKDLVTLHPVRALIGALKLPGDLGMDVLKGIGGFQGKTRAAAQHALAA